MNLTSIARPFLLLPLFAGFACSDGHRANQIPPAAFSPPLQNNTNPPQKAKNATGTLGTIERLDPALDALISADAKIEI
jgi:hypothetical protein